MEDSHALLATGGFEGYGRLFVEAALAHLPIVTTDVGIIGEVLIPSVHVRTFPIGDSDAAARELLFLMNNVSARELMTRKAADAAHAHLAAFHSYPKRFIADIARAASSR